MNPNITVGWNTSMSEIANVEPHVDASGTMQPSCLILRTRQCLAHALELLRRYTSMSVGHVADELLGHAITSLGHGLLKIRIVGPLQDQELLELQREYGSGIHNG